MAAVAGLADFSPLTLRELKWRHDAVRQERWDHTATLALCISRGMLAGRLKLSDFHPFMDGHKPPPPKPENFPQTLTEAEIMERWNKVKDKVHG